jgi:hypothetical protein
MNCIGRNEKSLKCKRKQLRSINLNGTVFIRREPGRCFHLPEEYEEWYVVIFKTVSGFLLEGVPDSFLSGLSMKMLLSCCMVYKIPAVCVYFMDTL